VQAAGSGVSSAAIQIAKLLGAEVIASASTEEKLEKARELGADHTVNYTEQDLVAEVRRIVAPKKGVEVVVDHVGEATWDASVRALANGGRLVTCGATTGYDVRVDLRHLFYRRLSLLGSTMGSKGDLHRIVRLIELGKLRPVVDRVLPLSDAREAHRLLAERKAFGKVVLRP
jgi:NADPH:quinone reductase-like Zn-dependent oxidoreductase